MTRWREEVLKEVHKDDHIVESAPPWSDSMWDIEFDAGFGGTKGEPFTVWTKLQVLFPICYDGAEWVGSVSRNPDDETTDHQGGG
jgi:hypothetical protein